MKDILLQEGQKLHAKMCEINDYIYSNPELGNEEFKSSSKLIAFLEEHNFTVEKGLLGIETSFRAIYDSKKPGATIGYLCEYDALPEIGHGCGHNMIGVMSSAAGIALSKVIDEIGGKIIVYGTPAEETNGAKVVFAEEGIFDELDVAMLVHPSDVNMKSGTTQALYPLEFRYKGKTAHAASCPQNGVNALNSVIQLFNGIDALRQHVTPDVRMHGIIVKGGVAENIAEGAALMTGATLEMERYEFPNDNLVTNENLSEAFNENLRALGITEIKPPKSSGSSDIGNVSHKVPTIHPYIQVSSCKAPGHTVELAEATVSDLGHERLLTGAMALAYTGYDVLLGKVNLER